MKLLLCMLTTIVIVFPACNQEQRMLKTIMDDVATDDPEVENPRPTLSPVISDLPEVTSLNATNLIPGERYRLQPLGYVSMLDTQGHSLLRFLDWSNNSKNPSVKGFSMYLSLVPHIYEKSVEGVPVINFEADPSLPNDEIVIEIIEQLALTDYRTHFHIGYSAIAIENLNRPDRIFEVEHSERSKPILEEVVADDTSVVPTETDIPEITSLNVGNLIPRKRYRLQPTGYSTVPDTEGDPLIRVLHWSKTSRVIRFSMYVYLGPYIYEKSTEGVPVINTDDEIVIEIIYRSRLIKDRTSVHVGYDAIAIENLTHPDRIFEVER